MTEEFLDMILEFENDLNRRAMTLYKGDEYDAEDLVQDTILKALDNEDKYEKGTNLRGWLLTIMFRLFVNKYRRNKKFHEICDRHNSYTSHTSQREAYHIDPLSTLELDSLLNELKANLDDIFYETLESVDVLGNSYKEASRLLGIPVGTVMSRLFRARRKSREVLMRVYDPETLAEYLGSDAFRDAS